MKVARPLPGSACADTPSGTPAGQPRRSGPEPHPADVAAAAPRSPHVRAPAPFRPSSRRRKGISRPRPNSPTVSSAGHHRSNAVQPCLDEARICQEHGVYTSAVIVLGGLLHRVLVHAAEARTAIRAPSQAATRRRWSKDLVQHAHVNGWIDQDAKRASKPLRPHRNVAPASWLGSEPSAAQALTRPICAGRPSTLFSTCASLSAISSTYGELLSPGSAGGQRGVWRPVSVAA